MPLRYVRKAPQPKDESTPAMAAYRGMVGAVERHGNRTRLLLVQGQSAFDVTLRGVQFPGRKRDRPLMMTGLQNERWLRVLSGEVQNLLQPLASQGQPAADVGESKPTDERGEPLLRGPTGSGQLMSAMVDLLGFGRRPPFRGH